MVVNGINKVNMSSDVVIPSPQRRRRARTRQRILDAARATVRREGIDGLTLGAIAKALDLTTPALYRYFPNKGALLAAVNAEVLAEQRAVVRRIAVVARLDGSSDALLALLSVVEATVVLSEARPDDFALLVATLSDPRTLVDDLEHAVHIPELFGLLMDVVGAFERAVAEGSLEPGDAETRALSLVFSVLGSLQTAKLTRFRPSVAPGALARTTARALLQGFGADPKQLDRRTPDAVRTVRRATLESPA